MINYESYQKAATSGLWSKLLKTKAAVSGFGFLDILTTDASKAVLSSSFLDTVFVTARAGIECAAGVATVKGVIN